jgi:uncharacterized protein YlxW (UPF0749 family)
MTDPDDEQQKPKPPDEPTVQIDLPAGHHETPGEAQHDNPAPGQHEDLTERIELPVGTDSDRTERISLPVDAVIKPVPKLPDKAPAVVPPADTAPADTVPAVVAPTDEPTELLAAPQRAGAPQPTAKERLSRLRRSRAGAVIGVLAALLGFGIVVQAHSTETSTALPAARQEDLVRILDDLDAQQDRLRGEIGQLQTTRQQLSSGATSSDAALAEAHRRTQALGLLAGTVPATGPGLLITITDSRGQLTADVVLDAVEELRGAGAEALQMAGKTGGPVRITVSSYFLDGQGSINVSGTALTGPYQLLVIGDPATLDAALRIPGGVVDTVTQQNAKIAIEQRGSVTVSALRPVTSPQYARPTS